MDKFFKRKLPFDQSSSSQISNDDGKKQAHEFLEVDLKNLPADPGQRSKISAYHPNVRDEIRRAYLLKGPCQPREHKFPQTQFGKNFYRFNPSWFNEFGNWLEYSISKDAVYCLCCYLMKPEFGEKGGGDSFITEGFSNWKKKDRLQAHVGVSPNSIHNQSYMKCQALLNQKQHIEVAINRESDQVKQEYRT